MLYVLQCCGEIVGMVFVGLLFGSVLLFVVFGFVIMYGLIGVINMVYGEFLMIGVYVIYVVQMLVQCYVFGVFDWYLFVVVLVLFVVVVFVGIVFEWFVLWYLYGCLFEMLFVIFGVSLILIQVMCMLFGVQNVQVVNLLWMSGGVMVMQNLILLYNWFVIFVFVFVVVVVVWVVLMKMWFGLFVCVVMQNCWMVVCVGVKIVWVDVYVFVFGVGIVGFGGCVLLQIGNVGFDFGQNYIIDLFMVVVFGGVGQIVGIVFGGFGFGFVSKVIELFWGVVFVKIVVFVMIVLFIQKCLQGMFVLKGCSVEV